MDVRDKSGRLLGWLNCKVTGAAGFAWYGPGPTGTVAYWAHLVHDHGGMLTYLVVDNPVALGCMPHFTALPDDQLMNSRLVRERIQMLGRRLRSTGGR